MVLNAVINDYLSIISHLLKLQLFSLEVSQLGAGSSCSYNAMCQTYLSPAVTCVSNVCSCPSGFYWFGTYCGTCPSGTVWSGSSCGNYFLSKSFKIYFLAYLNN